MWTKYFFIALCVGVAQANATPLVRKLGNIRLIQNTPRSTVDIVYESSGHPALSGHLGTSLPAAVGTPTGTCEPGTSDECFEWNDFARLYLTAAKESNQYCARVEWYSPYARRLEDCFDLEDGVHWYGGPGPKYPEAWPIEIVSREETPMATGVSNGPVAENYWVLSSGVSIHVDEDTALFFSVNSTKQPNKFCLAAQDSKPFRNRGEVRLKYDICTGVAGENFRDVHKRAIQKYYGTPRSMVDEGMLLKAFWSTWAEYKADINQTKVLDLGQKLLAEGFEFTSHVQIDDDWETCYGELEFNPLKFPDPAAMVATLKQMGLRTTLWAHPFINYNCPIFNYAVEHNYLVKDENGRPALTGWWVAGGDKSGFVDFTNPAAVEWWTGRLEKLRTSFGIDSFKFDAGQSNDLPFSHQLQGNLDYDPNLITTEYVKICATFGTLVELRVARQNQNEPIFIRMGDKDSRWGADNGLQSLIPTLLDFGIKGYPYVLPDMVGGNAYGQAPSKELIVRWMQANAFMPSLQISLLPWNYDAETVNMFKDVMALRELHADKILLAAQQAQQDGSPVNRPMWWVDPTDVNTLTINDQYMLGDDILVAPVVVEGAVSRNVYLPVGQWSLFNGVETTVYSGPMTLENVPAPLGFLPYFVRSTK